MKDIGYPIQNLDTAFSLTQKSINNLPQICASGRSVIVPDSNQNKFQLFSIYLNEHSNTPKLRKRFLDGISVSGEIYESSNPAFDGLYYNFLHRNILYRVAAEENVETSIIKSRIANLPNNLPKKETLLITDERRRLLVFQHDDDLIFLDIGNDDDNPTRRQVRIRPMIEQGELVNLLYCKETKYGYAITQNANYFRFDPSGFYNDDISISPPLGVDFNNCKLIATKVVGKEIKIVLRTKDDRATIVKYDLENTQNSHYAFQTEFLNLDASNIIFTNEHILIRNLNSPNRFIKIFDDGTQVDSDILNLYPEISVVSNNRIFSVDRDNYRLNILSGDDLSTLGQRPLINGLGSSPSVSQVCANNNIVYILTDEQIHAISV